MLVWVLRRLRSSMNMLAKVKDTSGFSLVRKGFWTLLLLWGFCLYGEALSYELVEQPDCLVVGISCRIAGPEAAVQDIPRQWKKFFKEDVPGRISPKASSDVRALYYDYGEDGSYAFLVGCPVTALNTMPEGMVGVLIPAGTYALFRAIGEVPTSVGEMWKTIWNEPNLCRTYRVDYEVYGEGFFSRFPQEVEIYVGNR